MDNPEKANSALVLWPPVNRSKEGQWAYSDLRNEDLTIGLNKETRSRMYTKSIAYFYARRRQTFKFN